MHLTVLYWTAVHILQTRICSNQRQDGGLKPLRKTLYHKPLCEVTM